MTDRTTESSPRLTARVAGLLYLIVIVAGVFVVSVFSAMIVHGDAAATATKIVSSESLFRLGFAADLISAASYTGVTALLYALFKPVNRSVSLLAAFLGLVGCAVGAVNALNHLAPLILLGGAPYLDLAAFKPDQLQVLALTFLKLNEQGNNIALVFFGFYCVLLGYLVLRSTFLPRTIGVLLAITGLSYLINSFAIFLSPAFSVHLPIYILGPAALIGEGSLCLWLLVIGVNVAKWRAQANITIPADQPVAVQ